MRITGGLLKGRSITNPAGLAVRPTASKIRQAIFNILGNKIVDARILDVFAGTGLIGFEALSRGAAYLVFVEESSKMTRAIESSVRNFAVEAKVISGDFRKIMPRLEKQSFDIIFADPPYKSPFAQNLVTLVVDCQLLKDDGILVIEHARSTSLESTNGQVVKYDQRDYGQTAISFFSYRSKNC